MALTINTGTSTIANAGIIEAAGAGGVSVLSAVNNTGRLIADGGALTVDAAVTGTGVASVANATLTFASSFSQNVTFGGAYGELVLAQSQGYAGTVSDFSKTGATTVDLEDIAFIGGTTKATYAGTTTSGVLTVTDGTHTAEIKLAGNYTTSTFTVLTDGHGGTIVADPPKTAVAASPHPFVAAMAAFGAADGVGPAVMGAEASNRQTMLSAPRV